jgi:hypothetical protein
VLTVALYFVLAYLVIGRLLKGKRLQREEWTLILRPGGTLPESYRDRPVIHLSQLKEKLARWGYDLSFRLQTADGDYPVSETTALCGPRFRVEERRCRRGRLYFQLMPRAVDAPGWGSVEVDDNSQGTYGELALYLIFELGLLIPGMEYKRSFDSLTPENTAILEPQLPARPHYLPR